MAAEVLRVVCAWCQRTVTAAPAGAYTTHTICPSCVAGIARLSEGKTDPAALKPSPDSLGDVFKD
jgi:hypothetical protein